MSAADEIADRIREAARTKTPLRIRGGGSKAFYGEEPIGDVLDVRTLEGPANHEPTELVVTAPAAMRIVDLEALLAQSDQCLPFEPPRFTPASTVGGMIAAGLAGPSRAATGSVRDHLLGVSMLDGRGELLHFGGRVIKNVAGYDVSRAMAGSLGVLGVIVEASIKVLPGPPVESTRRFDVGADEALARLRAWCRKPLPIDASCWHDGSLFVRLRGSSQAVAEGERIVGGDAVDAFSASVRWLGWRDQSDAFFADARARADDGESTLWRLSLPNDAPPLRLPGRCLIEWHGAERWLLTDRPAVDVRSATAQARGHATIFRGPDKSAGVFAPLTAPLLAIHARLKRAFDPHGILNPGRLHPDL